MSCPPHRVTSGQSNSGHKQIHISKLFSHIYQPSVKSIYETNHFANIHTQTSDTNFRRVSPFNITPVKRTHKARTCRYRRPFRLIYRYQVKEKYKKGMDRHIFFLKLYKCIMANTRQTNRQAGRQAGRQTDRQTGRQAGRQADRDQIVQDQCEEESDKTIPFFVIPLRRETGKFRS